MRRLWHLLLFLFPLLLLLENIVELRLHHRIWQYYTLILRLLLLFLLLKLLLRLLILLFMWLDPIGVLDRRKVQVLLVVR